jgi:outer membrane lipoprotein-sorting protein
MKMRWLASAILVAAACACYANHSNESKGKDLMVKSLRGQFEFNIVAIVSQQDSTGSCYDTLKVERSSDGKIRHTFLAPICMQGICSMDDGEHSFIYWPDEKRLVKQDSNPKSDDAARGVALALRNYSFKFDGQCHVAGRKTNCVIATPVATELEVRRYYLDAKTAYPLKLETIGPDGQTITKFETKDVQFPSSLDSRIFAFQTLGEVERVERRRPSDVDPNRAAVIMGFRPIMPHGLPMGFQVQEVQEDVASDWHALIIRLSDGLVRATLYQWKSAGANDACIKLFEKNSQVEHRGIRLVILADLPQELRERLLAAFISDAEIIPPEATAFSFGRP